jgi:hypothetical protein
LRDQRQQVPDTLATIWINETRCLNPDVSNTAVQRAFYLIDVDLSVKQ